MYVAERGGATEMIVFNVLSLGLTLLSDLSSLVVNGMFLSIVKRCDGDVKRER